MSRRPLRAPEDAPEAARTRLGAAEQRTGRPPNRLRGLATAPVTLDACLSASGIDARGSLPPAEREAVQITAAAFHGCGFRAAGHMQDAELAAFRAPGAAAALEGVRGVSRATLCNFADTLGAPPLNPGREPHHRDGPAAVAAP